jgi:hypothetical protein
MDFKCNCNAPSTISTMDLTSPYFLAPPGTHVLRRRGYFVLTSKTVPRKYGTRSNIPHLLQRRLLFSKRACRRESQREMQLVSQYYLDVGGFEETAAPATLPASSIASGASMGLGKTLLSAPT